MAARSASPIMRHGDDWVELSLPYDERLIGMPETGHHRLGPDHQPDGHGDQPRHLDPARPFRHQATLDLRVDYLRPATPGHTIIGRGICYGVTKSVGFVRGLAHDGDPDDPVANVTGTFMFTD